MSTKKGELELNAVCGECEQAVEINWTWDLRVMHSCDPGCCCGECYYMSMDSDYDVEVSVECQHCGVLLSKALMSMY